MANDALDAIDKDDIQRFANVLRRYPYLINEHFQGKATTLLFSAVAYGRARMVELLLQLDTRHIDTPDSFARTPIHQAATLGHVEIVEMLMRFGCRTMDWSAYGSSTPMYQAARYGYNEVIEALVRFGSVFIAEYNNNSCMYPICAATIYGNPTVETLHYLGAPLTGLSRKYIVTYDEERSWEIRYRVYFQQSLLWRCLFKVERRRRRTPRIRI